MTAQNPNSDDLVAVFENIDVSLVWIARDELESVGIESFIFDSAASRILRGFRMFSPRPIFPTRLMVRSDKADEARECLRELGIEK